MAVGAVDEAQLRDLIPEVLAALVHRGAAFATAEDAVQEALVRAFEMWGTRSAETPDVPEGWLMTTAGRGFIGLTGADTAGGRRESDAAATELYALAPHDAHPL